MQPVVCDSSMLIHLAKIERLHLLRDFYGKVVITRAVWREVVEEGKDREDARLIKEAVEAGWIAVDSPANEPLVKILERHLHPGEAETIALAVERSALVLLDESEGRRVADIYGLRKTGVVGILLKAKLKGAIPSLKKELDALRHRAGFWISDELYSKALKFAGEE
ncbi:MAG: DUF3368 domain-containing protein [Euryarchaeota archaeon]|nr:DUF3368 domain-containing protein [Euryarchaeota archaeon]